MTQTRADGNIYLQPDTDIHNFTYIDDESVAIYQVRVPTEALVETSENPAILLSNEEHSFKV